MKDTKNTEKMIRIKGSLAIGIFSSTMYIHHINVRIRSKGSKGRSGSQGHDCMTLTNVSPNPLSSYSKTSNEVLLTVAPPPTPT